MMLGMMYYPAKSVADVKIWHSYADARQGKDNVELVERPDLDAKIAALESELADLRKENAELRAAREVGAA